MRALRLELSSSLVGSLLVVAALSACSEDAADPDSDTGNPQPFGTPGNTSGPQGNTASSTRPLMPIDGFGRPAGMAIGTAAEDDTESGGEDPDPNLPIAMAPPAETDDVDIPTFEMPPDTPVIPCTGCVQLSAVVDDINQRSQFMLNVGGVQATRVVWTILLPFNSDQLFIRSIVNTSEGPYTAMSANIFPSLNQPLQLVHQFSGTANTIGIAFGSQGAWTGDQRISVFVDSVTLEGSNTTRTFDTDAGGFAAQGTEREPLVEFH